MKYYISSVLVFMSGAVAALNLSKLVAVNPGYEAHWGELVFAVVLGICFSISGKLNT